MLNMGRIMAQMQAFCKAAFATKCENQAVWNTPKATGSRGMRSNTSRADAANSKLSLRK